MSAEHRADPALVDAVAGALNRSSTAALEASHELLAHYSDTGDARTQRAVDTLIDHAADALRALTDSLADISAELRATVPAAAPANAHKRRYTALDESSARPRRRREP